MKKELLLVADDSPISLESITRGIALFGKGDGHQVIGAAHSVEEVETLVKGGLRPTVALVDHKFPTAVDGERAAEIIKQHSPQTIIISFSTDSGLSWGDHNWTKLMGNQELVDALTKLQH